MPKVTIDGTVVEVEQGQAVLDAVRKAGIWLPTLCYNPAISSSGACRICTVELDRGEWRQLITACNYPVRRDIKISVTSEKAVSARKGIMELLLARSEESEELKALAAKMGISGTPYPKVTESLRNCILCGLCTKVCEEVIGCSAISFVGRGIDRSVAPPFRLASEDCIACGACAYICPVSTIRIRLHEETGEIEISPFKTKVKLLKCSSCGRDLISAPLMTYLKKRDKAKFSLEEFKNVETLCPVCKRKKTAAKLAVTAGDKG
ncbi:2Fe-2S iron-sulfur cluster-binding protein [Spirochaetota bacterium]